MLCFCVELTRILFYLKDLMTHMADPESCSVSVRLPDNQGGLAYYKCYKKSLLPLIHLDSLLMSQ